MYRLILYTVIYVIIISITVTINCLKAKKKGGAAPSENKSPKKPTHINYEEDLKALEKERKQRIAENRERMRKKREKQTKKAEEKSKSQEAAAEAVAAKKENTVVLEKKKEESKELLPEDKTQPTTTSTDSAESFQVEVKMNKTQPNEDDKTRSKESNKGSSDEELGDVQLVDQDPDADKKIEAIKKQAKKAAFEKQLAELQAKSLRKSESSNPYTPDDTMKNVSSIHQESEISSIQRKKAIKDDETKSGDTTCNNTTESIMVHEAILIEPKSNPIYLRQLARTMFGGSMEKSGHS